MDSKSYDASIAAMRTFIDDTTFSIDAWKKHRDHAVDPAAKAEYSQLTVAAERNIRHVKALQVKVAKSFSGLEQRIVGSLLHAEHATSFANDWALVNVYADRIGPDFVGNQLFLGHRRECQKLHKFMFSRAADSNETKHHSEDGYFKASGVVPRDEFEDPPHMDHNGDRCLIVVKNGATSNITIGRANSLESSTRIYGKTHDDTQTSHEIAVIPYDLDKHDFSEPGDSGSIVLDRDGRIAGLLTAGNGLKDSDPTAYWSYMIPFWSIQSQIEAKFGEFALYDSDN